MLEHFFIYSIQLLSKEHIYRSQTINEWSTVRHGGSHSTSHSGAMSSQLSVCQSGKIALPQSLKGEFTVLKTFLFIVAPTHSLIFSDLEKQTGEILLNFNHGTSVIASFVVVTVAISSLLQGFLKTGFNHYQSNLAYFRTVILNWWVLT